MDIIQLENYVAAVEESNLTKAAQIMHITQPALTRYIQKLESSIGVPLFDRNGKSITVNRYGELLYHYATETLSGYYAMLDKISELGEPDLEDSLTIACSSYVYSSPILTKFQMLYPDAAINTLKFTRYDFPEIILNNSIDCVLSLKAYDLKGVDNIYLCSTPLYFVAPAGHRLASHTAIGIREITNEPLTLSADDNQYHEIIHDIYEKIGEKPLIEQHLPTEQMIRFVQKGLCCSIFTKQTLDFLQLYNNRFAAIPLNEEFCRMEVWLNYRIPGEKETPRPHRDNFLDFIRAASFQISQ